MSEPPRPAHSLVPASVLNTATTLPAPPTPAEQRRSYTASFLILLAGGISIGFAPIFVRLSEVGPVATAFWRMTLSLPPLWLALIYIHRRTPQPPSTTPVPPRPHSPAPWAPMALAGVLFAADLAFWHWSLHFTSVANSTLLSNFAPVFVVVFGVLAFGHRVSRRFLLAMLVALAGTCLLVGRDFRLEPRALAGDALALVTAGFYGAYQLSVKNLRIRHGALLIMVRSGLVAAACLLPVALLSGEQIWPQTPHAWFVLVGLAVIVHAGGQGMIAYALARLPSAVVSVSLLVQPVTAALAAALILHEPVAAIQILGIALVLAGVFVARQEGR